MFVYMNQTIFTDNWSLSLPIGSVRLLSAGTKDEIYQLIRSIKQKQIGSKIKMKILRRAEIVLKS